MKLLLLLLLPLSSYCQEINYTVSGGTTIIAMSSKDSIWIGADTKEKLTPGPAQAKSLAKVFISKDTYCAMAGTIVYRNPRGIVVLDLQEKLKEIINNRDVKKPLNEQIGSGLQKAVQSVIDQIPRNQIPLLFPNLNKHVLETVAARFNRGIPEVYLFGFKIQLSNSSYHVVITDTNTYKNALKVTTLGTHDHIDKIVFNGTFKWSPSGVKDDIVNLINIEASNHPETVGGRIDVLVGYKKGYKWLTPKPD